MILFEEGCNIGAMSQMQPPQEYYIVFFINVSHSGDGVGGGPSFNSGCHGYGFLNGDGLGVPFDYRHGDGCIRDIDYYTGVGT